MPMFFIPTLTTLTYLNYLKIHECWLVFWLLPMTKAFGPSPQRELNPCNCLPITFLSLITVKKLKC